MLSRLALWGPLLVALLLVGGYIYLHDPFARDGTELLQVPLSEDDPALDRVGDLKYLGGLDIPRMGQNIGGLSGLRWDHETSQLFAVSDDGLWVELAPQETSERLTGLQYARASALHDLDGSLLEGKQRADSESLTKLDDDLWLVGFERDHRIWSYGGIDPYPAEVLIDLDTALGPLAENQGIEAMAGNQELRLICAERAASIDRTNCVLLRAGQGEFMDFPVRPPESLVEKDAVPTDADAMSDGTFLILFRSYSPAEGNTAAIVAYAPDGDRHELATFRPPLSVDNFEGLAVREEGERTFLYIVSDDNFSGSQRTLLMKFELVS